jgi:hypothetical protein
VGATASEIAAEIVQQFPSAQVDLASETLGVGQDLNERGDVGIRPAHIVRAILTADAAEAYEIGPDATMTLALKDVPGINYRLLILAIKAGGKAWVADARRLYDTTDGVSPTDAFATFVERFGCVIRGTGKDLFVPRRFLGTGGSVTAMAGDREIPVQAFIRATPQGTEAAWMYAVDPDRYRTEVRRHGR